MINDNKDDIPEPASDRGGSFKTVCLVRKDLDIRTVANVIGHCALALGVRNRSGLIENPVLKDADGNLHAGVSAWPFVVLCTRRRKLEAVLHETKGFHKLCTVAFMRPMLTTSTDAELVREVSITNTTDIEWLGVAAYGNADDVDAVFGSFSLWLPGRD